MDGRWQGYRGSGLSNAVGAITAAAFAALGVHELTTADPSWIKFAAEVIGSGAGGIGGAYLNDHLFPLTLVYPKRWRLLRLLRAKLLSDFKYSFLEKTARLNTAFQESNSLLNSAHLLKPDDPRIEPNISRTIPIERLTDQERFAFEATLAKRHVIKVNCGALFPAALSALLSLKERLKGRLDLQVDFSDENSHDQFERVSKGEYFDFIVAAEGPFFLATSGADEGAINAKVLSTYTRVFPCNIEWQHAFIRKGKDRPRTVHVFQSSSAKLQFKVGFGDPHIRLEEKKIFRGSQIPFLAEKEPLEGGECVIVWEPLAHLFLNNHHFEKVENGTFRVWISLFCSSKWAAQGRHRQLEAFRQLFIDEWRGLNTSAGHERAFKLLQSSENILDNFALSSGFKKDDKFAPTVGLYS